MGGLADATTVADQVDVEVECAAAGDEVRHQGLCRFGRCGGRDKAKAAADTMDVRVHREDVAAQAEEEHAGRGLRADTGQREKVVHRGRIVHAPQRRQRGPPVPRAQPGEDRADPRRLGVRQPGGADRIHHLRKRCALDRLPAGKTTAQAREGAAGVDVRRVLRDHRLHQRVQRRIRRPRVRRAVLPAQLIRHPPHAPAKIGHAGTEDRRTATSGCRETSDLSSVANSPRRLSAGATRDFRKAGLHPPESRSPARS